MTKAEAHFHAADIASTPKGAGQNGLVTSMSNAPKTSRLSVPQFPPLEAFGRRPRSSPIHRVGAGVRNPAQKRVIRHRILDHKDEHAIDLQSTA
jgi:hypothetical protein